MGPTAQPIYAVAALVALGGALNALGHKADIGKGIAAANDVIASDH
jgi:pyridoxamine--pyruvate transaminase